MKKMTLLWLLVFPCSLIAQKTYTLQSPNQKLKTTVTVSDQIRIALDHGNTVVLAPSSVSMTIDNKETLGLNPKVRKIFRHSVKQTLPSPLYKKSAIEENYNEMTLDFQGKYSLQFRLYNNGMAYRFVTHKPGDIIVNSEKADFRFPENFSTYTAYVNSTASTFEQQYTNSFEQPYSHEKIMQLNDKRLKILPLMVELPEGKKLCITEADLENYPGMFLNNTTDHPSLQAHFAPYPKVVEQGGHNQLQLRVKERENYIAKTQGTRSFPWRIFVVSSSDKELTDCDMVYSLASPSRIEDISWIKPGMAVWDWWSDWNTSGVDFKSGINNDTYKYYIDFAAQYHIPYVILDEGWSVRLKADLFQVVPELNLPELAEYAKNKNVGLILWAGYYPLKRDMEKVIKHYAEMGIKGFKVDFMDRDDQLISEFLYETAATCAKYKMVVDFHGIHKPTGLQRTYPNVLGYEGVNGLEQMKWAPQTYDAVTYDVSIPFIRMLAGPMDYTQGAMRNVSRKNYRPCYTEPMSQGTRCHQLAMYTIFESPFCMLCDNASEYMREPECTEFIRQVPVIWDQTIALDGKIAEYVVLARRHNKEWYVGAMTNWTPRELEIDLSFLGEGNYQMEIFRDGVNAAKTGRDYKREILPVPSNRKVNIRMAPGGGWTARIF